MSVQEQRPIIRLRDAIAFYDSLPDKTRKRFRAATDVSDLHFGFGMYLRNAILWKNDIKFLAAELKVVREDVGKSSVMVHELPGMSPSSGQSLDVMPNGPPST